MSRISVPNLQLPIPGPARAVTGGTGSRGSTGIGEAAADLGALVGRIQEAERNKAVLEGEAAQISANANAIVESRKRPPEQWVPTYDAIADEYEKSLRNIKDERIKERLELRWKEQRARSVGRLRIAEADALSEGRKEALISLQEALIPDIASGDSLAQKTLEDAVDAAEADGTIMPGFAEAFRRETDNMIDERIQIQTRAEIYTTANAAAEAYRSYPTAEQKEGLLADVFATVDAADSDTLTELEKAGIKNGVQSSFRTIENEKANSTIRQSSDDIHRGEWSELIGDHEEFISKMAEGDAKRDAMAHLKGLRAQRKSDDPRIERMKETFGTDMPIDPKDATASAVETLAKQVIEDGNLGAFAQLTTKLSQQDIPLPDNVLDRFKEMLSSPNKTQRKPRVVRQLMDMLPEHTRNDLGESLGWHGRFAARADLQDMYLLEEEIADRAISLAVKEMEGGEPSGTGEGIAFIDELLDRGKAPLWSDGLRAEEDFLIEVVRQMSTNQAMPFEQVRNIALETAMQRYEEPVTVGVRTGRVDVLAPDISVRIPFEPQSKTRLIEGLNGLNAHEALFKAGQIGGAVGLALGAMSPTLNRRQARVAENMAFEVQPNTDVWAFPAVNDAGQPLAYLQYDNKANTYKVITTNDFGFDTLTLQMRSNVDPRDLVQNANLRWTELDGKVPMAKSEERFTQATMFIEARVIEDYNGDVAAGKEAIRENPTMFQQRLHDYITGDWPNGLGWKKSGIFDTDEGSE